MHRKTENSLGKITLFETGLNDFKQKQLLTYLPRLVLEERD